ncbi:MAG: ribosomal-processing cysteine protease Prp [Oscillospiraceae bacterium]|nr:ribosomal-processing cysteine protease Prp [Oscillospiraceae bacterium]
MTKISITSGDDYFRIEADGHATGSDTVCAAVSALMCSIYNYADGLLHCDTICSARSGNVIVEVHGVDEAAMGAFSCVAGGLMALADRYPDFLCTKVTDNADKSGAKCENP